MARTPRMDIVTLHLAFSSCMAISTYFHLTLAFSPHVDIRTSCGTFSPHVEHFHLMWGVFTLHGQFHFMWTFSPCLGIITLHCHFNFMSGIFTSCRAFLPCMGHFHLAWPFPPCMDIFTSCGTFSPHVGAF